MKLFDNLVRRGHCKTLPSNLDTKTVFEEFEKEERKKLEEKLSRSRLATALLIENFGVGSKRVDDFDKLKRAFEFDDLSLADSNLDSISTVSISSASSICGSDLESDDYDEGSSILDFNLTRDLTVDFFS